MKIKKAIALMIGLVLIVSLALPGTLAVSADQSAASSSLTLAGGTVSSVPEEKEASTTEGTEAPTTEGTEAPTTEGTEASTTEGTEASTEGTDQTTAPTETEPSAPTEVTEPTQTTLPTEPETPSFDPQTVYDQLMACTTVEEMDAILDALTEEQFAQFTEEMLEGIKAHYAELAPADTSDWIPAVNVTNVAPLLPPVSGRSPLRTFSAVAPYANDATGSDSEGMHRSKTATVNDDGTYTIRLEAYATGESITTVVEEEIPTDIVLVLDQSGSMAHCIGCGGKIKRSGQAHTVNKYSEVSADQIDQGKNYYIKNDSSYSEVKYCNGDHWLDENKHAPGWVLASLLPYGGDHRNSTIYDPGTTTFYSHTEWEACTPRLDALKSAVTQFASSVATKAAGKDGTAGTEDDVKHRIALVGFASGDYYDGTYYKYGNTEVFVGSSQNRYGTDAKAVYGSAFQDMSTNTGKNNVSASINALDANGGTLTNLGIEMANGIFKANPVETGKRNRVMIVFTDGEPGWSGFDSTTADSAINSAYATKNTYGATVYTVGIFSGADGSNPGTLSGKSEPNKFMHYVSSNYTDATAMNNTGAVNQDLSGSDTYYLSAGDSDALSNIFQKISDNIRDDSVKTTLDDKAVIKDIVSPYFSIPTDAEQITVKTAVCNGTDSDGKLTFGTETDSDLTATISGDTVSVTGFNFKENWCGSETVEGKTTYRGKKLIIEFKVARKDGFLGGNDVPTNTSAGVYKDGNAEKPILEFEQPTVNVPIDDVKVTAKEKNVYLLNGVTADQLKSGATVTVGGVTLDLSKANDVDEPYGLKKWQTQYVNITVEVKDGDGNAIPTGGLTSLSDDTKYTITVTVEPTTNGLDKSSGTPAEKQYNSGEGNINVFKPELTFKDSTAYYGETVPTNNNYDSNKVGSETWKHGTQTDNDVTMTGTEPTLDLSYTPDASKLDNGTYTNQDVPVSVTVKIGEEDVTSHTTFVHKNCDPACGWKTPEVGGDPAFLIHVKSCTLTIEKKGWQKIDENQSFMFDVTHPDGKVTRVVIAMDENAGDSKSVTIKGLKAGTYTVTEDTGWSWRYEPQGNDKSVTLSANNSSDTVTFTNDRVKDKWLGGDAYNQNKFESANSN